MTNINDEIRQYAYESSKQKALLNLMFTHNWIIQKINDFFRDQTVTNQQFNVLRILNGQHPKPCTAKHIKEVMIFKAPDLTRLLDRLIDKKLAERRFCEGNRRSLDISITVSGIELLNRLNPELSKLMDSHIYLSESESESLSTLLDKARGPS